MIKYPVIDPVIISFGPLAIRWYSLAYVVGILFGWFYIARTASRLNLPIAKKDVEDFVTYSILGIVIGGRLGYVCFYDPIKYFLHPIEILKTYDGGMSFHGGLCGLILSGYIFCRRRKLEFLLLTDLLAMVAPVGLFVGRIANFINAEVYGKVTNVAWAMQFPGSDMLPRHPSQLYEAALEGIVLFCIINYLALSKDAIAKRGYLSGMFLLFYAIFRIFAEIFRQPDAHLGFILAHVTMGQILSVPMLLLGVWIIAFAKR